MTSVAVLVPVLDRPHRAAPVLRSALAATTGHRVEVIFLVSPGDQAEHDAVAAAIEGQPAALVVVPWQPGPGDYARKINHGFRRSAELGYRWIFQGADDIDFRDGWLDRAVSVHKRTRACWIGTNDTVNQRVRLGRHATHSLIHRDYLECGTIDEAGKILHEGYTHWFCNPPEAPIWMADCSFKSLGDVRVGDEVIGWTYGAPDRPTTGVPLRTLCYSTVEHVAERVAPLVEVRMESGRLIRCTADHRWLNATWTPGQARKERAYAQWVTPEVGRQLLRVIDRPAPVPAELERAAGWLAGIYDGEGSGFVAVNQNYRNNPEVVQRAHEYLTLLGIPYTFKERESGMAEFVLSGGRQGYLDFLLRVHPSRHHQLSSLILGWRPRGSSRRAREPIGARRFGHRDRIVSVRAAGEDLVVSLTTTSGNYVAWGYASRNCDDEAVQTALFRGTWAFARDSVVAHQHPLYGGAVMDETYRKGQESVDADRALYESRLPLWSPAMARRR